MSQLIAIAIILGSLFLAIETRSPERATQRINRRGR